MSKSNVENHTNRVNSLGSDTFSTSRLDITGTNGEGGKTWLIAVAVAVVSYNVSKNDTKYLLVFVWISEL